ncbi:NAD(P)-dependent oxidoreductase [Aeromicrobium stalagmiti]|uniref:NAD(P)-dependent oxidoreductase n=1 Tax=Aeromicrobium stalagmiti TaxID=2738988 RepID=UPI0015687DAB|nr:NAD(P)-dependent oxidoreductase [Aeromicrobium stalagmiti]NRQ48676.1 NAD(P)-dependent oxidoreductase [Aeromicrobium stalagmiti]
MRIAFLGLGRMGRELVLHIIDAGHDVTVWNRSPERARALEPKGVRVADSAADAVAGAELVVTTLFGPDTVRDVVLRGELPFAEGATWVDITTVAPSDATELAAWAAEHGVAYAHSPVIGSLAPARARQLGVLLGGTKAATDVALPVVSLWADPDRLHVLDDAARAATGKLVANLALAVSLQGLAEALRLGRGGGLTTDEVLAQVQDKTMLQAIAGMKGDLVRGGDFSDAQFSVNALAKDLGLMLQTTAEPLPAVEAAAASLRAEIESGHGEDDVAAIARPVT